MKTDPFTEWRKQTPYWLKEQSSHEATHVRLLKKMEAMQKEHGKLAQHAPNPLARTWHD